MGEVIYCNQCKYYDGVHGYPGCAPCILKRAGGTMWNDHCDEGKLYDEGVEKEYEWKCWGTVNDVNKLHELLTLTAPNPKVYTPNGDCYILYNRATNEIVFTDKEGV